MSSIKEVRALLGSRLDDLDVTKNNINVIDFEGEDFNIEISLLTETINQNYQLLESVRQAMAQRIINTKILELTAQLKEWKALLPKKAKP